MPPFVPRKRLPEDDPPRAPKRQNATPSCPAPISDGDDTSSLSDAPSEPTPPTPAVNAEAASTSGESDNDNDDEDDDSVDWEDAIESKTPSGAATTPWTTPADVQDLELTLDKNEVHLSDIIDGKKAPSKIERQIRIQTHCLHVRFLLYHNALRNAWACDRDLHEILRRNLPAALHKEVKKWRVASALEAPENPPEDNKSRKKKGKQRRTSERDWAEDAARLEPGQPDMSRGDPIIPLLKVLAAYWKKQFKITAPGLRKRGYRPMASLEAEISSFKNGYDPELHGERIRDRDEFRQAAERMEGSRDLGAQLFTALLRALDIEARLVASLQPVGFGWTKAETYTPKPKTDPEPSTDATAARETDVVDLDSDGDLDPEPSQRRNNPRGYDKDLAFPIYWAEVVSPITHEIIPVDPLILQHPVATTPELQAAFEPRGAKAEKAKQVICYVIAYSADRTAKDVTTRYLRRRTWPGKTKGFRLPVEKIPVPGARGKFLEFDWFRRTLRVYLRPEKDRTAVDDIEDTRDLVPNQPEKKKATKDGDTLQSLRTSTEFVLERFLRREEALRPGAQHDRVFVTGKGAKAKEEKVYRRADVLKCLSAESWHKEGRQIKRGEIPLKRVPIRAVTLLRKREVDELERETGEKPKQGLYARHQTEWIIPPPIRDGVIPKNEYGNIDCFVPSMVPRGAVHVPWPGTVRICKKLDIDYAEAVTGFEFGSKMAVPVIDGVVVAAENGDLVKDAWRADAAEKREKERRKAEARILQTWRKFLFGLRIAERVREEYGASERDHERDAHNPFTSSRGKTSHQTTSAEEPTAQDGLSEQDTVDRGGGFLLPGEDDGDDGGLIVEEQRSTRPPLRRQTPSHDEDGGFATSSEQELSSPADSEHDDSGNDDYKPTSTRRRTRNAKMS
ncbi:Rad4 transglutaminase-like domain-containing protein [Aspergillus ambiguus]|uniref:Rad4 family protein n=1 Tax=Aspergillus ambiguus TaxID=176160 RepID=UPI003CCCE9AC